MRPTDRAACTVRRTRANIGTPPTGARALWAAPVATASGSPVARLPAMTRTVNE